MAHPGWGLFPEGLQKLLGKQPFLRSVGPSQQSDQMFRSELFQLEKSNTEKGVEQKMDLPRGDVFSFIF